METKEEFFTQVSIYWLCIISPASRFIRIYLHRQRKNRAPSVGLQKITALSKKMAPNLDLKTRGRKHKYSKEHGRHQTRDCSWRQSSQAFWGERLPTDVPRDSDVRCGNRGQAEIEYPEKTLAFSGWRLVTPLRVLDHKIAACYGRKPTLWWKVLQERSSRSTNWSALVSFMDKRKAFILSLLYVCAISILSCGR